jgi:ribosome-binding protein aMBF1 (putative translation factor)
MLEVAKARTRAGLSQTELARRMKATQSTIARLESGRGMPSTRTRPLREGDWAPAEDQF